MKTRVCALPAASVAVTVTFVAPSGHPAVAISKGEASAFGPLPLFHVALCKLASTTARSSTAPARTSELFAGVERVIEGAVESNTKTNTRVRTLPAKSVAVTVTFTVPSGQPPVEMSCGADKVTFPVPLLRVTVLRFVSVTVLAFTVTDTNLNTVTRNNGTGNVTLSAPHDISTGGWPDGTVNVTVTATDLAGNVRTRVFVFVFDSTAPSITLSTPANNSLVRAGAVLDLAVVEANLQSATWNNGSGPNALASPFDIATAGWPDGATNVTVTATDAAGNAQTRVFMFIFDSTPPTLTLNAPANNSVVRAGTLLDFQLGDANGLGAVTWNNSSGALSLAPPYDVNTTGWADGAFDVEIVAFDAAGNNLTSRFHFTLDSTPPSISLVSPANGSVVRPGTTLDFAVADANGLQSSTWSNGSAPVALPSPYDVSTSGWPEGTVTVTVNATDAAGNFRSLSFTLRIDGTSPTITLASPSNNSV